MRDFDRLGLITITLLCFGSSACSIVPSDRGGGKDEIGVGLIAAVGGVYLFLKTADPTSMKGGRPPSAPAEPAEEAVDGIAPGFVVPGGGTMRVDRGHRQTLYEFTYGREPATVLVEFEANLEKRGWQVTQVKEARSLAYRVTRGGTTVLVLFTKDEQDRIVITAGAT